MENFLEIVGRTIIVYILLFFVAKMLGKKQISQFNLFDYIVGITIGSIAADISLDLEKDLLAGMASLFLYCFIAYIISLIAMKSIKARRFFKGVPTVLVENAKVIDEGLKKTKIDINELLSEARIAGYFNLDEIAYAIMEINGSISFLPKDKEKPVTKKDMQIKEEKSYLTANVIIDGKYMDKNVKALGKNKKWVDHELKVQGYNDYSNILLATVDDKEKVTIYKKGIKANKDSVLK